MKYKKATLILEDGQQFEGYSFGSDKSVAGEIVFNTAMTGYPESLTDPSYEGQILVLTYPSVGNYGVPGKEIDNDMYKFFESDRVHITALIISDYSEKYNHWNAVMSLGDWLKQEGVPGLFGIDTRMLTKIIREKGTMLAKIVFDEDIEFYDPNKTNLVEKVSVTERKVYGNGKHKILLIDCGVKSNIIRYLLRYDTTVIRVPWDYDYSNEEYDGLFISNGPGDPVMCVPTIKNLEVSLQKDNPVFGICLGHQLVALASGAETYKLKFGHHGGNHPVKNEMTGTVEITAQNHNYNVPDNITEVATVTHVNLFDNTIEGLKYNDSPTMSVQHHPEASPGPHESAYIFGEFAKML